jgi:hypothetical protein
MKALLLITAALGVLVAGCGEKSDKPAQATNAPASRGSVITAPVDYLGAIGKAQQRAVKTIDTTSLNQAIQLFNVQEGRYPKDLNELVAQQYIGQIPTPPNGTKIVYDASTGKVTVANQ